MRDLNSINSIMLKYSHIVGTGGIGSGMFFKLEGNHTMGRNESRPGIIVPFNDYCKLHIIMHYISVLLGAAKGTGFQAYPIGKVGDDKEGRRLLQEIKSAGMVTDSICVMPDTSTLFSVCFQYPDNTGGNITTACSASSKVTPDDIQLFFKKFEGNGDSELILAVPEVNIDTRIRLLETGRARGSFNIASVLSSEVDEFSQKGGFKNVDLLAVNIDEAKAIAGITDECIESIKVVNACVDTLLKINPKIFLVITDGPNGSYGYKDNYLEYTPILNADVVGTAGAGDAFLAGVIVGLCCHLPFLKGKSDKVFSETPLCSAVELGTLLAALSVTSPHAIFPNVNMELLFEFAKKKNVRFISLFSNIKHL